MSEILCEKYHLKKINNKKKFIFWNRVVVLHIPVLDLLGPRWKHHFVALFLYIHTNCSCIIHKWLSLNFIPIVCMHKFRTRYYSYVYRGYHNKDGYKFKRYLLYMSLFFLFLNRYVRAWEILWRCTCRSFRHIYGWRSRTSSSIFTNLRSVVPFIYFNHLAPF